MTSRKNSPPGGCSLFASVFLYALCSTSSFGSFEMTPPRENSLPDRVPINIVDGVSVFPSPPPSATPARKGEAGGGVVEVRGFSMNTPDGRFDPTAVYKPSAMPKMNKTPATDGHHRTLVGFYAVKPTRGSIAPRRIRFEIELSVPDSQPETTIISTESPADGKIRLIPIPISLPIIQATLPGEYRATWTVIDETTGDWDMDTAYFTKASVEKVADVDPRKMPTPPAPVRRTSEDGFVTKSAPPQRQSSGVFETGPVTPQKSGGAHEGFMLESPASQKKDNQGFERPAPSPRPKPKTKSQTKARQ